MLLRHRKGFPEHVSDRDFDRMADDLQSLITYTDQGVMLVSGNGFHIGIVLAISDILRDLAENERILKEREKTNDHNE